MPIGILKYNTPKKRKSPAGYLSENLYSKNYNQERPLKNNHDDLSFKGLSFSTENKKKKDDKMKPVLATLGVLVATGLALRLAPSYKKTGEYSLNEFFKFVKDKSGVDENIVRSLYEHVNNSELTKKMVKKLKKGKKVKYTIIYGADKQNKFIKIK